MDLRHLFAGFALVATACVIQPAAAATISFGGADVDPYVEGGLTIDVVRIVNGNCGTAPCMALNDQETPELTKVGGGTFTLNSFWFQLIGGGTQGDNALTVTSFLDGGQIASTTLSSPTYSANTEYTFTPPVGFSGIDAIIFSTPDGGNVRIDDITVSFNDSAPSPVPLPGAFMLMGSVVTGAAFVAARRKRKNTA